MLDVNRSAEGTELDGFLAQLADPSRPIIDARNVALVVAHPDDETIGCGAQLPRLAGITWIHVTDGAPAKAEYAIAHGFASRDDYAAARARELAEAARIAGVPGEARISLGLIDQQASLDMARLAQRIADLLAARGIQIVLTHPYEGGHPDHDACAFAVHAAAMLLARSSRRLAVAEMAFYHAGLDGFVVQRFSDVPNMPATEVRLAESALQIKQRLVAAHASQAEMLSQFTDPVERFRAAPSYRFSEPPNSGRVNYEHVDWGMTGGRWRELATDAERALGILTP